ncbi:response regulator [Phenylobacterium sp. 20VBR1]|uniref:histidine kinase n=1 Tax=Phenylobacterium glaciei TaxID=2803784 RepID=A0A941D187_9CAUL|nr:ATP-binding protein [Phenylobacterium glaciei]MBR7620316.1 response regulator [Phenylobacterium glaciei]
MFSRAVEPVPSKELAAVYRPVVRGYLIAAGIYYLIITASHPFYERGAALAVLMGLSAVAAVVCLGFHRLLRNPASAQLTLEMAALATNALILANVVAYLSIHYEAPKLVYFVIMALGFATVGPSVRILAPSVILALAALVFFAGQAGPGAAGQYAFVGLAGAFGAIGLSNMTRGVVMRELRARLAAEALNRQIERELATNQTLRIQAQDLARIADSANRSKTEFLATISHELRTPLNGVLGMAQAMSADPLSKPQRSRLGTIQESGRALLSIINDVLDISKIEAGRLELSPSVFNMAGFAQDLAALYGGLAQERGLDFSLEITPDAKGWRRGDEVRLRQVISNLLSNALKFTEVGSVTARIDADGDLLKVLVTDTGLGIAAERAPQLFEKFVQADASTTRRFGGTGLGLSICREILGLMGGEIDFTSTAGEGSCFSFTTPLARAETPTALAQPAAEPSFDDDLRVLVADDNPTNRLVIRTLLEQFGIETITVDSGTAAIEAWEGGTWSAILMDIHMPGMDGLDATREIRAREQAGGRAHIPIIAVTASVLSHETDAYFAAGMDDFIAKPIELARLLSILEACLNRADEGAARVAAA